MPKHKRSKKSLISFLTQYGIHMWAILLLANAIMVYTYHISTNAAGKSDTKLDIVNNAQSLSPSPAVSPSGPSGSQVSPSSGPLGPVINLIFTVPGIGSGGGILKPLHTKRNVTIYLYAPNVNSTDPAVNPLYTVQGTATYDDNPVSPTYTSFINPFFDLGAQVQDGNYQIGFKTDLSFTTLVKQTPTDVGGEVFGLNKSSQPFVLPTQSVAMGDIIPSGNNFNFTINDYNAFISCFGVKNTTTSFCKGKNYGDFNDDGVIDGIDYNIMIRSLYSLVQQGEILPKVSPTIAVPQKITKLINPITPTTAAKKPTATPKKGQTTTKQSSGGAIVGIIFFLFFLILLGGGGFFLYLKNEKVHAMINALIHLSPTGTPSEQPAETTEETADAVQPTKEAPATTAEQPVESAAPVQSESQPAVPSALAAPAANGLIEKDCYVKKKGLDETGTGIWLLLTDDNGAVNARYTKTDVQDGFAKVKGVMKTENGKTFLEVSELSAE